MSNESSENVIRFRLQIDGADDAVKEFQTVAEASEQVDKSIESIKSKTKTVLPDTSRYFEEGQRAIGSSFKRIKDIDEEMAAPNVDSYRAESLAHEKEMLRRSIEATMQDISDVSELSNSIYKQLGGSRKNSNGLKVLNETISDMYSAAKAYAGTTRRINGIQSTNVLMSDQQIASGLAISDAGKKFLTKMNISAGSQTAQDIFAMIAKTAVDQVKRSDYMKQIAGTSDIREHVFESFSQMLPTQFRNFHNGVKVTPQPGTPTRLTTSEFNFVKSMLLENPYFAEAAEKTGMARRQNGVMQIYGDISREMLNKTAGNLYNRIVNAAKGMPMFGIKDVDDPDKWENIARKTNKPFIGGMNAARQLADAVPWLAPEKSSGKASGLIQTGYRDVGAVTFGPMIKRYEAARYTLDDLRNGVSLNDTKRLYDKATNENAAEEARKKYFSLDHSLHLENIFKHRTQNQTPENNEAIDDVIYLQMEKELGNNQLDPARREDLEKQYANYVLNGITTMVRGRKMHYSFSRVNATSGLGFEFIADPIYNKILQEDPTYFTAGLKEQGFRKWAPAAGALEYGNKNATTGQNIKDLYGSNLPGLDKVKIALVNMEHLTKGTNENGEEVGAGVNGASWINAKYTPAGFQGRIHGVKSALNRLDMKELYNLFGGNLVAPSVNGTTTRLTGDEDFIINLADVKNAEERFGKRDEKGDLVKDDKGNVIFEDAEKIIETIKSDYQKYGVFVSRTMDQANGRTHWMSRQMASVLKGDKSFSDMTTKAFLDEFHRVGTLEGALDTVFADDSETRDLLLRTNGAIMGSRMIQSRIEDYRKQMMARASQGDVLLPNDLNAYRAMAGVWAPSAFMNAMKKINASGTGMKKEGEQGSFYDTMYKALENDKQREFLDLVTLEDNEVAFNKSMAKTFGIYRYPATLSSAQKANNATVGDSKKAQAIRSVMSKLGMDQSGIYVSPSSPLMDLLQDADFDGDVLELIEMSLTGRDAKSGRKVTAAEVMDRAFSEGMKRIEERRQRGEYTDEEARRRKDQFTRSVYGDLPDKDYSIELHATKADGTPDMERRTKAAMTVARYASTAAQNGSYMGAPDAANRNAAQVPWSKDVMTALMDAELMYSVNSVRGKKGKEYYVDGKTHSEYLNVLANYRPLTEFFHLVDKTRDEYGNVSPSNLIDLAKGSDGLEGARFWNTNIPFKTMSSNVRSAMLSRFFAKKRGFDINADYDWETIFDTVLGKKDESTALGRMQAGLRDTWMGILNADFLAPSNETIAYLNELRDKAIQEQEGIVAEQRKSAGFKKKGSNVSIATNLVDRLGGRAILNARTLGLTEESIKTGENKEWYDDLIKLGFSPESIIGNVDGLQRMLQVQTDTSAIDKVLARGNKSTQLSRALDLWNTQTDTQKKARIDSMKRLSFSTISQFAEDPASFIEMLFTGKETEASSTAIEFGQAAHFAIEHFMRGRMNNPDKNKPLSPERLAELQEEAKTAFKEYLGIEDTHKYTPDKLPTRGFNDAERRLMDDPSSWLNKRKRDIMNFFDDGLMKFMNDEEWEVIGIESSNIGNEEEGKDGKKKAKRASADRMVIEGKGKKLENPDEDVEFTGAYDLMFKNRKSGETRVVDIKNYGKGDTLDAVSHWRPQQLLYAGQLIRNGLDVKSIQYMLPLQNAMRDMQFDARDIERNDENVKAVVSLIQKLGTGRQTISSVTELAAKANEFLFGETEKKDYSDHFRGGGKKGRYGGSTVNSGTITDALYMHDRFSEAEKESDDIMSFIGKETRPRDREYSSFRNWQNAFIRNDNILGTANFFENAKQHDEAQHFQGKYEENLKALRLGLGNSIINDQNQFAEDIRGTLVGGEGTEKGQALAKMYGRFQRKQEDIANKRDLLRSIIEANEKEIEEQGIDPEGYEKNRDKLAREGKFIDSLIKNIDAFTAKDASPQAKRGAKGRLAQLISKNADMFGENALLSNETLYDLQQLSPTGILSAKAALETAREKNKQSTETNEDMIAKAQANPNVLKKNYDESKRELAFLDKVKETQSQYEKALLDGTNTGSIQRSFTNLLKKNQDLAEKFGVNDIRANMFSKNETDRQSALAVIDKARVDVKGRVDANESLWKNSVERVNGLISENEQLKSAETMSKIGNAGVQDLISKFKENFNNELSRYFEGIEHQFADMMGDKHGVEDIVGKAKSNFVKSVYQAITDVEELAKEGAISPEEAEQKKAHYQAILRDENMRKVGEKAKKDALIEAGIISETPQEKAQKWLDARNKAREATSREKLDELKATADRWGDIYEKDRSPEALRLWGEARQRYSKEAAAKARDEQIAGQYGEILARGRAREVEDLLRPEHQQLSVEERVKRAVEDRKAALNKQYRNMGENDPGFMDVYNLLFNNPEYWENFAANQRAKISMGQAISNDEAMANIIKYNQTFDRMEKASNAENLLFPEPATITQQNKRSRLSDILLGRAYADEAVPEENKPSTFDVSPDRNESQDKQPKDYSKYFEQRARAEDYIQNADKRYRDLVGRRDTLTEFARNELDALGTRLGYNTKKPELAPNVSVREKLIDALVKEYDRQDATTLAGMMLQSQQRQEAFDNQAMWADAARARQYSRMNRNQFFNNRSRLIGYYDRGEDQRFALDREASSNQLKADQMRARIDQMQAERQYLTGNAAVLKDQEIANATAQMHKYQKAANAAAEESMHFGKGMNLVGAVTKTFGDSIASLAQRLGRRLFMRIGQEVMQFAKQYDKAMTDIQMITLKSDTEMTTLGEGLVNKAKDLKISFSEISQMATDLYRQGLSDEEMNERLDTIAKFSKVSGTKATDATKLITTAMNTGLVTDPQFAADVVTALGDSAATNAAQIEKGIEKAGAAAAVDGTTYEQLVSLLTAVTATTQVSGSVAGTTLNSIFGRMNKIGTNDLIYDENGNAVSGSDIAKLLRANGVATNNKDGSRRSTFEMLYDLAQRYEGMSDDRQRQIATTISGTRQFSNFGAIMTGIREGDIDRYLNLASSASGTTNEKFDIYLESLQASLDNLRNTFNGLVKDLTGNNTLTGAIDFVSGLVQGFDNLTNSIGGVQAAIVALLPLMASLVMMRSGNIPLMLGGLAVAGATAFGLFSQRENASQAYASSVEKYNKITGERFEQSDRLNELRNKTTRTEAENKEYASLINQFAANLGLITSPAEGAAYSIDALSNSLKNMSGAADEAADSVLKEIDEQKKRALVSGIAANSSQAVKAIEEGIQGVHTSRIKEDSTLSNPYLNGFLWDQNENGEYILREDAAQKVYEDLTILHPFASEEDRKNRNGARNALATMLANANFDDEEKWDPQYWLEVMGTSGMGITQDELNKAFNYTANRTSASMSDEDEKKAIKDVFKNIFTQQISSFYSDSQIEKISDYAANKYFEEKMPIKDVYNEIMQPGKSYEEFDEGIKNILKNYPDSAYGIENEEYGAIPEAAYYYDRRTGARISRKEAEKMLAPQKYTYKEAEYDSYEAAEKVRNEDIAKDIEQRKSGLKSEKAIDLNGDRYAIESPYFEEQVRENEAFQKLVADKAEAAPLVDVYRDKYGNIVGRQRAEQIAAQNLESVISQPYTNPYSYTDDSGTRHFFSEEESAIKALETDVIEKMINEDYGAYRNMINNFGEKDYGKYIREWYKGKYGTDIDRLKAERVEPSSEIAINDLTEEELADYKRAMIIPEDEKPALIMDYIEKNFTQGQAYEAFGNYYDTLEDLLSDNKANLEEQVIGELKQNANDNNWYIEGVNSFWTSYEEAEQYIKQQINALYENAENALQITGGTNVLPESFVPVVDYFTGEAYSSYANWKTDDKNRYALLADKMYQMVQSSGISNVQALSDFINNPNNPNTEWQSLYSNSEFGRIMSQIIRNDAGEIISAPDDIMDQINGFLMRNGRIYGERALTTQEVGQRAYEAYSRLQNGAYISQEAAENAARDDYEIEKLLVRNHIRAGSRDTFSEEELADKVQEQLTSEGIGTLEAFMVDGYESLNDEDRTYLEQVLGKGLAQKIKTAYSGGSAISAEEETLASTLLGNARYGISGLTSSQKLQGIRDVREAIESGKAYSTYASDMYMSGFANWADYRRLTEQQQKAHEAGEELSEADLALLKQYNAQLDKFESNAELEVNIKGLEETGELLKGTLDLLTQIRKGGSFKIDALINLRSEMHDESQRLAMYQNGTVQERASAVTGSLKISEAQYYNNQTKYDREFEIKTAKERADRARQLEELYKEDAEEALKLANEEGYNLDFDRTKYTDIGNGQYIDNRTGSKVNINEVLNSGAVKFTPGSAGNVDRLHPLAGQEKQYSDYELFLMRQQIMSGQLKLGTEGYSAAVQSGGREFAEYQRLLAMPTAGMSATERREHEDRLKEARNRAIREQNLSESELKENDELEQARQKSGTLGGMFAYSQLQYKQNNKAGLAANSIFATLANADVETTEDLLNVLGDKRNAQNWKDLLESSPELTRKLSELGLSIDSNGNWTAEMDSLAASTSGAAEALRILIEAAGSLSEEFNNAKNPKTKGEEYDLAKKYWNGEITDREAQEEALRSILPEKYANNAIYQRSVYDSNLAKWNQYDQDLLDYQNGLTSLPDGYSIDVNGNVLNNSGMIVRARPIAPEFERPDEYNPVGGLSQFEAENAETIMENAEYGRTNLTDIETYNNMQALSSAIATGSLHELFSGGKADLYSQTISGKNVGNMEMSDYMEMVQRLENANLNINDVDQYSGEKLAEANEIMGKYGKSAEDVSKIQEDFNAELAAEAVEAAKVGDSSKEAADGLRTYAKSSKDAAQQTAKNAESIQTLQNQMMAAEKIRGKKGSQIKGKKELEAIGEYLGISDPKKIKNYLKDMSKDMVDSFADGMETNANERFTQEHVIPALSQFLQDAQSAINAGDLSIKPVIDVMWQLNETGDVSGAMDLAQQIGSEAYDLLAPLEGLIASLHINVDKYFDENGGQIDIIGILSEVMSTMSKPSGYGGGGGGGGGGGEESEVQKMLKRHKDELSEQQHKIKMEEIYQTHFDFINDYDAYLGSLDKEAAAYDELSEIYQRQIDEMKGMMGAVEEGTADYYSLRDALRAAEEGLADVQNKLNAIENKRVDIIISKEEIEDKPSTQKQSLWEQKTRGYQLKDQFESYAVAERKRIEELNEQRKLNEDQIKTMEETLMQTTEGGDAWIKARDDIWKMQVENAQLVNDMEEARRKLETDTINQWQTDLTNRLLPREHEQTMLQSYQGEYQTNRQWDFYRSALGQNNEVSEQNVGLYTQYMNQMIEQLDTLEKGSEAWYAAREAVFSYEEAIAQATLSIEENNRAIEQSKVDELKDQFEQINNETNHTLNILKTQRERYDKNNNFTMYQRVIGEEITETTKQIANLEDQLRKYVDLSNDLTKDSDAWRTNQEQARSTAEQIENAKNQLEEYKRIQDQSKFEHDQEVFQRQNNLDEHQLKMIQYQGTRYQNRGELTNVNTMLGIENKQREEMISKYEKYIDVLKEDLALTEKGSDEYYKIADAIYKAEEEVDNHTSAIEKNTDAIRKNEEAILKTHKALVDAVNNEVQQRVKQQKDQLSSEVSIQNQILSVIRKRYQQEWALVKEDIAKKKQALNEEKNLINERLNARLQAEDKENKYAELSELKRQLSIISSDPTRNHNVKELEKRIKDMERDIANTEAKENAQAEMDKITDQIKAMDEYAAYQEKVLNDMLKDANSTKLSEELRAVLGDDTMSAIEGRLTELIKQRAEVNERVGILKAANPNYTPGESEDELELARLNELIDATQSELEEAKNARFNNYMDWIRQNDENYKYGTEEFRAQMEQQNIDSWNKMLGWIDTYWDQVHDIIDGGIQNILDYMRESRSYQFAEDESAQSLIDRNLENLYEAWQDANRDDAAFTHAHDEIITEIKDEEIEINKGIHDLDGRMKDFLKLYMHNIRWDYIRPTDIDPDADKIPYNDYLGIGKKHIKIAGETFEHQGTIVEEPGGRRKWKSTIKNIEGKIIIEKEFDTEEEAIKWRDALLSDISFTNSNPSAYNFYTGTTTNGNKKTETYMNTDYYKILDAITEAKKKAAAALDQDNWYYNMYTEYSTPQYVKRNLKREAEQEVDYLSALLEKSKTMHVGTNTSVYKEGGYVDYTGPAWVDGTPSRPEAFLDATDTELLRNMLDSYNYVKTLPLTMPHERNFGQQNSFGDINIVINQAEMKTGADIDNVARQVAKTFVRQLSMEGLRVNGL